MSLVISCLEWWHSQKPYLLLRSDCLVRYDLICDDLWLASYLDGLILRALLLCFHQTSDLSFSSVLSYLYLDPPSLSSAEYIRLPCSSLLSLITPIINSPWYYLVADPLSPYQRLGFYLVWYLDPQSSVTVSLGLCPLGWVALPARRPPAVYKMY